MSFFVGCSLEPCVDTSSWQDGLHVEHHVWSLEQLLEMGFVLIPELAMRDRKNQGVIAPRYGGDGLETVVFGHLVRMGPGIRDVDGKPVTGQFVNEIGYAGIADVGAVFLEGESLDQHPGTRDRNLFPDHEFDNPLGDMAPHLIVDASAGQDDFRLITHLCAL